jgi:hypothetical protein
MFGKHIAAKRTLALESVLLCFNGLDYFLSLYF